MTEQIEKLIYELSIWRASPELKVRCACCAAPACWLEVPPRVPAAAARTPSCACCAAPPSRPPPFILHAPPSCTYPPAPPPFPCVPPPHTHLQERAKQVQARHAAGAEGEFLETKKNT